MSAIDFGRWQQLEFKNFFYVSRLMLTIWKTETNKIKVSFQHFICQMRILKFDRNSLINSSFIEYDVAF